MNIFYYESKIKIFFFLGAWVGWGAGGLELVNFFFLQKIQI